MAPDLRVSRSLARPAALFLLLVAPSLAGAQAAPLPPQEPAAPAEVSPLVPQAPAAAPDPEAPVAPPRKPRTDECGDAPAKGLVKAGLPAWATGAVVGGLLGGLGTGVVGLTLAAGVALVSARNWLSLPYVAGPSLFALAVMAIPVGGVLGAVVGGLLGPLTPRWGAELFTKPCTRGDADPTLRPSGKAE